MQTVNKKALAQGAISLLTAFPKDMKFDMRNWLVNRFEEKLGAYEIGVDHCGSSCCLLGWIGVSQGVKGFRSWYHFQDSLGIENRNQESFLFEINWPSDKKQAARRVLMFLEKGIPAKWGSDFAYTCLTSLSNKQVIHRLEKFL